jgi:hypothetical protein
MSDNSYYEPFDKVHFSSKEKKERRHRFKRPPKNEKKGQEYQAKTPHPNYWEFGKPQYVDLQGRQYRIADKSFIEKSIDSGMLIYPAPDELPLQKKEFWGTQALFVKIPKNQKNVTFPEAGVDSLQLIHVDSQVIVKCSVESAFYYPRSKTGHLIVKHFTSIGQAPDPSLYKDLF